MKKNTHPKYQQTLFVDSSTGYKFVCGSTYRTEARETYNGVEYPVFYASISSASHPLYTGSSKLVDSQGRVDKFNKRYTRGAQKEAAAPVAPVAKPQVQAPAKPQPQVQAQAKAPAKKEAPKKEAPKKEAPKKEAAPKDAAKDKKKK